MDGYFLFAIIFGCSGRGRFLFLLRAAGFGEVVVEIIGLLLILGVFFIHTAKFDFSNIINPHPIKIKPFIFIDQL